MSHFHTLSNTPRLSNRHKTTYIVHDFPQHVVYRARYKDDYVTNLVEYEHSFVLKTGHAAKDVKWFQKQFPGSCVVKDLGIGIWFAKKVCDCGKKHTCQPFKDDRVSLLIKTIIDKYGPPSSAILFDGGSFSDKGETLNEA